MRFNAVKRAVAAVISLALGTMGMNVVSADSNWTINFVGTDKPKGETYFAEYTMAAKYDGDYSLNVVYPNSAIDGNYLEISTTIPGTVSAGTYDFKFYINKTGTGRGCSNNTSKVEIAGQSKLFNEFTTSNVDSASVPSGEADWICYSTQVTLAETVDASIKFVFVGPVRGCYLDEISLSTGGSDNLITCGGFETVVQESDVYDAAKYTPKEIIVAPTTAGGLAVSWRNPEATTIKEIELYDVTDSDPVLLSDSFTKTAKAINEYATGALTAEKAYQYKLIFTYSDVPKQEYFITGTAQAAAESHSIGAIGEWKVSSTHRNTAKPYSLYNLYIDTSEKHSGEASAKLATNNDKYYDNVATNMILSIAPEEGKDYQLSFWVKADNLNTGLNAHLNWKYFDSDYVASNIVIKNTVGTYDWKQVTVKKSDIESGATNLTFCLNRSSDGLWIDDLELYELDENGETTGDNLIPNGDFENLLSEMNGDLSNVTASAGMGTAKLGWKAVGDVYGVNIYQQVGEEWAYRGTAAGSISGVDFTALKYDMDYKFRLVPVTKDGVEGTAYDVAAKTTAPDYMVSEPALSFGGTATDTVDEGGTYTIKTNVKNNIYTDGMAYELVVGIFKDGALYELHSSGAKTIPCSPANSNATPVSINVTVPADSSDYSIKAYHINSKAEWGVLTPHTVFE